MELVYDSCIEIKESAEITEQSITKYWYSYSITGTE